MFAILWLIVVALFVLWIAGLVIHWTASIVWILFVVAVVLLVVGLIGRMSSGRPMTNP